MPDVFAALGLLELHNQSGLAEKIILWTLVGLSFAAWTVMLGKYLELDRLKAANRAVESLLTRTDRVLGLDPRELPGGVPFADLIREALAGFGHGNRPDPAAPGTPPAPPAGSGSRSIALMENALQRAVTRETSRYESSLILLATVVSGAPFLGLLGTVWGVMNSFAAVAAADNVTLKVIAPGVAGALLTTIAGLLVAIPAAFGYNYLVRMTRLLIVELETFASQLADRIEIESAR